MKRIILLVFLWQQKIRQSWVLELYSKPQLIKSLHFCNQLFAFITQLTSVPQFINYS